MIGNATIRLSKKILITIAAACLFTAVCQHTVSAAPITTTTTDDTTQATNQNGDEEHNTKSSLATGQTFLNFMSTYFQPIVSNTNLFFTGGLVYTLSTGDKTISPINSSLGIGYSFHLLPFLLFQPRLTGWGQYYLWDNAAQYAYPAEVENRTSTTIGVLTDFPFVMTVGTKKNMMELGLGAAVLARYSFLANAVSADDLNSDGSTTAEEDVHAINEWCWDSVRWLYPETFISYIHLLSNGWRLGLETRFYLPLGSLISNHGMDGMMLSVSLRLVLPETATKITQ